MLRLENISSGYGLIEVLHGVSLEAGTGDMVSIIGANGAGKSTLLRTISGLLPCTGGRILFEGVDVTGFAPHKLVQIGITQVPEGRRLFGPLTVYENLLLGSYSKYNQLGKSGRREQLELVFELFPVLAERRNQIAGTLSGGEQQMLAIGRGLMAQPKLLLLDEPSLGLSPKILEDISNVLQELNQRGLAIVLVEQNAALALELARYVYLLSGGNVALHGEASKLKDNAAIKEVYLGGG